MHDVPPVERKLIFPGADPEDISNNVPQAPRSMDSTAVRSGESADPRQKEDWSKTLFAQGQVTGMHTVRFEICA